MRYLDPKNDFAFYRVFGEHKHLCISLLNAMLPLEKGRQVVDVEYQTGELLPRFDGVRNSILDVRCEDNEGWQFIVEIQMYWTTSFRLRARLDDSQAYVTQFGKEMKRRDPCRLAEPVYALNFVNDVFAPDKTEYYHHYAMVNAADTEQRIDGLTLVFIELPKFKPDNHAVRKLRDLWLLYLTEIGPWMECAPTALLGCPETNEAVQLLGEHLYTRRELDTYDRYLDMIACEQALVADAHAKGFAEGFAEVRAASLAAAGRAECKAARANAIALAMLKAGFPQETVAEYSDLAVGEVIGLAKGIK